MQLEIASLASLLSLSLCRFITFARDRLLYMELLLVDGACNQNSCVIERVLQHSHSVIE